MRNIRTNQDSVTHSSERYNEPIHIPVFSFPTPATGDESPTWSPPYPIIINSGTASAAIAASSTSPLAIFALKRSYFSPDPIFIMDLFLNPGENRMGKDVSGFYYHDRIVNPDDQLYCGIWSGDGASFDFVSIELYAERARKL